MGKTYLKGSSQEESRFFTYCVKENMYKSKY